MTDSNHHLEASADDNQWQPCQAGQIQHLVSSLRKQRRNKTIAQASTVGSFVLLFAILFVVSGKKSDVALVFTCDDVIQHAEDYVAGKLTALVTGQIDDHLSDCQHCREQIATMKAKAPSEKSSQNETAQPTVAYSPFNSEQHRPGRLLALR